MKLKFFTLIFMLVMLNAVSTLAQKYEVSVDENVRKLVITTYQDQILVDVLCIENEQNSGFITCILQITSFSNSVTTI